MRRVIVGLAVVGVLAGCSTTAHPHVDSAYVAPVHRIHTAAASETVVYEVGGSARSADITYQTPGGSSQQQGVDVPLTLRTGGVGITYTFEPGAFLYISAQNMAGGSISCTITVDGVQVSHNVARGAYAIAQCDGS